MVKICLAAAAAALAGLIVIAAGLMAQARFGVALYRAAVAFFAVAVVVYGVELLLTRYGIPGFFRQPQSKALEQAIVAEAIAEDEQGKITVTEAENEEIAMEEASEPEVKTFSPLASEDLRRFAPPQD